MYFLQNTFNNLFLLLVFLTTTSVSFSKENEKNLFEEHQKIHNEILYLKNNNNFSFEEPFVIINPYKLSPLSAYLIFNLEQTSLIKIIINEMDKCNTHYSIKSLGNKYLIPLIGLKEGYNQVKIIAETKDGNKLLNKIKIKTENINHRLKFDIKINTKQSCKNEIIFVSPTFPGQPGLNLMGFNKSGQILWYLDHKKIGSSSSLVVDKNGYLLINSEELSKKPYYFSSYYKINLMGKIMQKINNSGYGHHEVIQLPNNNYLALVDNYKQDTIEDRIVELNESGKNLNSWSLKKILKLTNYKAPDIYKFYAMNNDDVMASKDWIHLNALTLDHNDGDFIVSSRVLNAIIKIGYNDKKIKWILTDPKQEWLNDDLRKLLLKPRKKYQFNVYSYGQHSIKYIDKGELIVFDNGLYSDLYERNIYSYDKSYNIRNNRSRGLIYKIFKESKKFEAKIILSKDSQYYSSFLGSISKNKNSYLINYGGILKENGNPSDNIMKILFGESKKSKGYSSIFQIINNKEIFYAEITGEKVTTTYRSKLFNIKELIENYVNQ